MTLIDSPNCEHCGAIDTLTHFFCRVWLCLCLYSERPPFSFTLENILFGIEEVTEFSLVINYISLIAKYFINTNRLKSIYTLDIRAFLSMLKYKLRIEKNISMKNQNSHFDKFSRVFEAI